MLCGHHSPQTRAPEGEDQGRDKQAAQPDRHCASFSQQFIALLCLPVLLAFLLLQFALSVLPTICLSFPIWAGNPSPMSSPLCKVGGRGRAGNVCMRECARTPSLPFCPLLLSPSHTHTHTLSLLVIFNVINFHVSLLYSAITCASVTSRALVPRWARPSPLYK